MDKEAVEKVTELHNHWFGSGISSDWQSLYGGLSFTHDLSNMLKQLGYRKPLDRPGLREILENTQVEWDGRLIILDNVDELYSKLLALIPEPTLNLPDMKDERILKLAGEINPETGELVKDYLDAAKELIQAYKELIIKENKHLEVVK